MKKINLMDVMESLNSDDVEGAQAALHEWFVEQGKQVQAQISGVPVVEDAGGTYVLFLDPNDGYDRVWGFQSQDDASYFMNDIQSYFGAGMYAGLEVAKVVSAADGYELPTNLAPAGCFNAMKGLEGEDAADAMADWSAENEELYSTDAAGHGDEVEETAVIESEEDADEDKEEVTETAEADEEAEDVTESEEAEGEEEEQVDESYDDLVAELNEAFKGLETVSDKLQNVEGAQVGEQGKVPVNTKATLPSHKGKDRVGGEPVEIKGKGHTGHALETAPKVVDVKVKNTVQNGKEELKKVADKGDAKALLNKRDGKENTQSPISGKGAKGLK